MITFDDVQPTVFLRCCQFLNLKAYNLLLNRSEMQIAFSFKYSPYTDHLNRHFET